MTETETGDSIVGSCSDTSIEEKQIIDQLIVAIENIIDSMEQEKNKKKINKFSEEEKLFNLAAKSRTFKFHPNYNKDRLIAGAATKIDGFRTIKDDMAKQMSATKPPKPKKKKKPKKDKPMNDEKPKEVKSKDDGTDSKEPNFDQILTICADILNGHPCGVAKKEEKYISAFGCCGYLSHQGKPVFKDPTDYSSIYTPLGGKGGGKGGDGEPTDIFKMEMPPELQKMVSGQKKVEHAEKQRAERNAKRQAAIEKGLDPDKDLDENGDPIVTDGADGGPGGNVGIGEVGVGGRGGVGGGGQPKPKMGKALMKDISKKRDKLITDEKLFNKKMDELNSRLKNALLYQKLVREGSRPKYRTDVTIHEWLMIIFGAKGVKRPVCCRPCGDCCHMNCIC